MAGEAFTFNEDAIRRIAREVFARERKALDNTRHARPPGYGYVPPRGIVFRNTSGEEIPPYAVMRITGAERRAGRPVITVAKPSTAFKRIYLVNGSKKVGTAATAYGIGTYLEESGEVLYESGTPAVDESWGPKNGQWSLAKWRPGFTITGAVDSTGLKVLATQAEVNGLIGKTTGAISASGGTGTINVWMGETGSEAVSEYAITCTNLTSLTLVSGKWGSLVWRNGNWYYEPWQCP